MYNIYHNTNIYIINSILMYIMNYNIHFVLCVNTAMFIPSTHFFYSIFLSVVYDEMLWFMYFPLRLITIIAMLGGVFYADNNITYDKDFIYNLFYYTIGKYSYRKYMCVQYNCEFNAPIKYHIGVPLSICYPNNLNTVTEIINITTAYLDKLNSTIHYGSDVSEVSEVPDRCEKDRSDVSEKDVSEITDGSETN